MPPAYGPDILTASGAVFWSNEKIKRISNIKKIILDTPGSEKKNKIKEKKKKKDFKLKLKK